MANLERAESWLAGITSRYGTIIGVVGVLVGAAGWLYNSVLSPPITEVQVFVQAPQQPPSVSAAPTEAGKQHFELKHALQIEPGGTLNMSPGGKLNYSLRPGLIGDDLVLHIEVPGADTRVLNLAQVTYFPVPISVSVKGNRWIVLVEGERDGRVLVRNFYYPHL